MQPNAKPGAFTLAGFPEGSGFISLQTELTSISKLFGSWFGAFDAEKGLSGGPLLTNQMNIVGIQTGALFGAAYQDRIDATQLQAILHWMHLDQALLV